MSRSTESCGAIRHTPSNPRAHQNATHAKGPLRSLGSIRTRSTPKRRATGSKAPTMQISADFAAADKASEGTQPTYGHSPPARAITTVRSPIRAVSEAIVGPPAPAPTMQISADFAAADKASEGTQPTYGHSPPACAITTVRSPIRAVSEAIVGPPAPAPTMQISVFSTFTTLCPIVSSWKLACRSVKVGENRLRSTTAYSLYRKQVFLAGCSNRSR